MASKEVTLALAAFLDSPQAAALGAPPRAQLRQLAERLIGAIYQQLGSKPRLLEGQDLERLLVQLLPGHFKPKDPLAEHIPSLVYAYFAHLEATEVLPHLFELRNAMEPALEAFLGQVRAGENVQQYAATQKPVVHRADKLGRNEPCSCGSGKKYKKCHGKS